MTVLLDVLVSLFGDSVSLINCFHSTKVCFRSISARRPVKCKMADAEVKSAICSENAASSKSLSSIEDSDIDIGRFKYVLILVKDKSCRPNAWKYIVRGYKWASFHADVFEKVQDNLEKQFPDVKCSCPGGGRILHDPEQKTITVFGYSQGYGRADHKISVSILEKKFTDYKIDWNDEGY